MPAWNQDFLAQGLAGLGLLILCVLGYRTIAWFRQDARGTFRREEDALMPFREAFEAGEIDREEYERVKAALTRQQGCPPETRPAAPQAPESGAGSTAPETPSVEPF
jgi:hypothetical protein